MLSQPQRRSIWGGAPLSPRPFTDFILRRAEGPSVTLKNSRIGSTWIESYWR